MISEKEKEYQKNYRYQTRVKYKKRQKVYQKEYRKTLKYKQRQKSYRNQPENKEKIRNQSMYKKYGIGLKEYKKIWKIQNGKCLICGEFKPLNGERENRLRIDHDHSTNKIRGLLCIKCNSVVGYIKESLKTARKLVEFLEKNQ